MSEPPVRVNASRHVVSWLRESRISLAFTTYQTNRLFLIGAKPNGRLSVFERLYDRPMGLWGSPERLVMSTNWQIWELYDALADGETYKGYDHLYVPRRAHTTGAIDTHDVAIDADGRIVFINTAYSCLATTSERYSFEPVWQPSFISQLVPEDRCHLNGLAMRDGRPAYVTAVSRSDVVGGWRERREAGGCVIDVASSQIVTDRLSMPHSPRVYRGDLWLLNSGSGELGRVDPSSGVFDPVCFAPGFLRGLAFHDNLAVVGLSKQRQERTFSGLELDDRLREKDAEAKCGLYVINVDTGVVVHWIELEGVVEELYDVVVLPGVQMPTALGFRTDDIAQIVTLDTKHGPVSHAASSGETSKLRGKADPQARSHFKAAEALIREGKLEEAVASYVEGLIHDPHDVEALVAIGSTQAELGRLSEAVDCLRRAVAADPASVKARAAAAALLLRTGGVGEAISHLREAFGHAPDDVHLAGQLAHALYFDGRFDESKAIFEHIVRMKPGHAEAYNGLAAIAGFNEDLEEALRLYEQATKLAPHYFEAHQNLGRTHEQRGDIPEADEAYARALAISDDPVLSMHRDLLSPQVFASSEEIDVYRTRCAEVIAAAGPIALDADKVQSSKAEPPFDWSYQGRDNLELKTSYAALFLPNLGYARDEWTPRSGPPWRIGFIVTPTHEGIFGRLMSGVIDRLDPRRFRVELFCSRQGAELLRQAIRSRDVTFRELPWRFDHAIDAVRSARLDAIYHWEVGTDAVNHFMAHVRLAPLQCTGWGWPDTSGAPELDVHLTSEALLTPGVESRFSERLVAMPHMPGFVPRPVVPERPMARAHLGLEDGTNVYLCAQTLRKVHPDMDALIAGILEADPRGRVVFVSDKHATPGLMLRGRWLQTIPHVQERVLMLPRLQPDEYFHLVANADVCIDTPHFGGTVTTYDAFAAGVPVVTLPGEMPRSRNAAALNATIGADAECVAADASDYAQKAVTIGTDRGLRSDLSSRIRDGAVDVFECPESVTQLEDFLTSELSVLTVGV